MEVATPPPRAPRPRRYSLATPPASLTPTPSPTRPPSAFPTLAGTVRSSISPSSSLSSSSSPPRSGSPDDKGSHYSSPNDKGDHRCFPDKARNYSSPDDKGGHPRSTLLNLHLRQAHRRRQHYGEEDAEEEAVDEPELYGLAPTIRPRTYSLPVSHARGLRPSMMMATGHEPGSGSGPGSPWRDLYTCPVRSFSRTTKGMVNRGDSVRKCSLSSVLSSASGSLVQDGEGRRRTASIASQDSQGLGAHGLCGGVGVEGGLCGGVGVEDGAGGGLAPSYYRVAVLGTVGVGKSALCRQFMSSEYLGTYGDNCEGEEGLCIVSVMLDGEESMIEFTEGPTISQEAESNYDAYIIVFSVTDRSSFDVAAFLLRHLRVEVGTDRPIIVVANKVDLVRQRRVSNAEARDMASSCDGKYTETSAALNDHVDDLLVGALSQIRFRLRPPPTTLLTPPSSPRAKGRTPSPLSLFSRFVKYATRKSSSCDNLLLQ